MDIPDNDKHLQLASEVSQTLQDLDAILDQVRLQERTAIADWITQKATNSPVESRLLYYLLAKDIRAGKYAP